MKIKTNKHQTRKIKTVPKWIHKTNKIHRLLFVLTDCSWAWGEACGSCTPWNSIGENLFFLWKWLVTANNFSVRGGIRVWLDSVLLQSLWVHTCIRSCCVWNTLLPRCSPPSLAPTGFLPPLLHIFLRLKGKGLIKTPCLEPSALQSLIVCALYSCRPCYFSASPSSGPQRFCQEVYNPCHWIQPSLRLESSYSMWKTGMTF